MKLRVLFTAGCVWVCAGGSMVWLGAAPSTTRAEQKLTPDEIFEFQNKQDQPGSTEAGRSIFEKQCASCHRFGEIGRDVGPDLTTITSRFKKKDVLEAILWPSKVISDQYQAEMIEMSDGSVVTGVLVRENATAVVLRTAENPDRPVQVQKAKIATRAASTVSLMPEALLDGYSQKDITDLMTFVMSPPPSK
jgi:putative heme-binding domain-containing protein